MAILKREHVDCYWVFRKSRTLADSFFHIVLELEMVVLLSFTPRQTKMHGPAYSCVLLCRIC